MKKIIAVIVSLTLVMMLASCGGSASSSAPAASNAPADDTVNIGLIQLVEHPSLDEIRTAFEAELKAKGYPVVCTGDFNAQEGTAAYNDMTAFMHDTKHLAKKSDCGATYKDYGLNAFATKPIDFIFVSDGVEVDTYKIIDERIKMMYLSDHAGLCADIRF